MSTQTVYTQKALTIVSWIIFIGICIEAGGLITNTIFTLFYNTDGAKKFWMEVDLSELYNYNERDFITITCLMIITSLMKALLFYNIVKIFYDKKFTLSQPFNETTRKFILNIAYLASGIALFSFWGASYTGRLLQVGIKMPDIQTLRLGGADVWLFMCVILFIIAHVFKKGIEIQNENDLTV